MFNDLSIRELSTFTTDVDPGAPQLPAIVRLQLIARGPGRTNLTIGQSNARVLRTSGGRTCSGKEVAGDPHGKSPFRERKEARTSPEKTELRWRYRANRPRRVGYTSSIRRDSRSRHGSLDPRAGRDWFHRPACRSICRRRGPNGGQLRRCVIDFLGQAICSARMVNSKTEIGARRRLDSARAPDRKCLYRPA